MRIYRLLTDTIFVVLTLAACSSATPAIVTDVPTTAPTPVPPTQPSAATDEPSANPVEFLWSITGEPNALNTPADLATDTRGNLYVVDAGNNRIQIFDSEGQFVRTWGKPGSGPGEFNFLRANGDGIGGIAVDLDGNVYVADNANQRIQKFDSMGTFLLEWGSNGANDGQFLSPFDIAIDPRGDVYVIDDARDDIQKFDRNGTFLLKWGSHGTGDGQFNYTGSLGIDSQGNVYVADFSNHRVQKFDSQRNFIAKWGSFGDEPGQFNDPGGIAIDPQGNIYVAEYAAHPPQTYRVQMFDGEGNFLGTWGSPGNEDGEFTHPLAIAVDHQGHIYVSDETNRIQKFRLTQIPTPLPLKLSVEDVVGFWKDVDGYIEFKPDGTWAFATTFNALKAGTLYAQGTFSIEEDELTILDNICGNLIGVYRLETKTENKLTFIQVKEECIGRRRLPFLERLP